MQHTYGFKPFIPAWADEAGWTPAEFRIYAHLCRRAGGKGRAFPSIRSVSLKCRLHKDTVCKCLKALETQGYLKRVRKHGRSNTYHLYTPADLFGATQLPLADGKGKPLSETEGQPVSETEGQKGIERKVLKGRGSEPSPNSAALESETEWRQRLQDANPGIDVAAELKKAARWKPRFERGWFEQYWLPKCTPIVGAQDFAAVDAVNKLVYAEHCEEGMALFRACYPASDCESWQKVPIDQRQRYASEVVARSRADKQAGPISPKKT